MAGLLAFTSCNNKKEVSSPKAPVNTASLVTIGSGVNSSLSYLTGHAIAQTAKKRLEEIDVRLTVNPTGGSMAALKAVLEKKLDLALVSSFHLYQAVKGRGPWEEAGRQESVLSVFTLYTEALILVTAETSGIRFITDLKGKRINIGLPGSDEQRAAILALDEAGLNMETDVEAKEIDADTGLNMLQEGRLDAAFYMTVHPDEGLKTIIRGKKKLRFIPIPVNRTFLLRYPYYVRTTIPAELYPEADIKEAVETFGIKTMLVASTTVPKDTVYAVIEGIFDNVKSFNQLHPAYRGLTKKNMTDGMYRMIHRGALYYYMRNGFQLSCCF